MKTSGVPATSPSAFTMCFPLSYKQLVGGRRNLLVVSHRRVHLSVSLLDGKPLENQVITEMSTSAASQITLLLLLLPYTTVLTLPNLLVIH